ncbi:GNAT family N-acetyltransferase [Actinoplanes sichuanensis]|uniref:GNAT family N-acetyltransferase n=1 Tax=Actinoplanes sichuanensis TaxID=512349 RepID=A0ABW4ASH1_9ACTN|nr:GNAT family N-acetyltransferase [Actinoplanes sichuanensis]
MNVVLLHTPAHLDAAAELLRSVWQARTEAERLSVISTTTLRSLSHSGNYVAGAFDGTGMVGCAVGWAGLGPSGPPDHMYVDITGVARTRQGLGVGTAIRLHQRRWALDRGLRRMRWTFDPLVARNAYFNLCKIGATVTSFEADFYGRLDDGTNTDQTTDRFTVDWDLTATAVGRYASIEPGAELIPIPADITALQRSDPARARRERLSVRDRLRSLLDRGYHIAGLSEHHDYVLLPPSWSRLR